LSLLPSAHNWELGDKQDIYQFGLILLEVITGKPTESQNQLESLKAQVNLKLQFSITTMSLYFSHHDFNIFTF
jgi:hypothetical protein